jgi:hypothetical protein
MNNVRDAGYWGFNVMQGEFGSALIVATTSILVKLHENKKKKRHQLIKINNLSSNLIILLCGLK